MDLKIVKMCTNNNNTKLATFESKDSAFCAQSEAISANSNLDLNQNHKKSHKHQLHQHLRQSSSPVGSSSSSVSSISPNGETILSQDSPAAIAEAQNRSSYEQRSPIEPFYPIPINSSAASTTNSNSISTSSSNPSALSPMEQYRLQFYNYAMVERLRNQNSHSNLQHLYPPAAAAAYNSRLALSMSLFHNRVFQPEEPKPQHSYIGLIAMAILSTADQKLVLSDIYQHILDNYPYFRTRGPGWRNSIRHNLSLNDCFIKAGRSANGKGHYWGIHPANLEDFKRGDFRRRKAQRKVRKHMGLAVDDDGSDSPSPPPLTLSPPPGLGFPMSPFGFRFGGADVASHWTPMMSAASLYTHSSRKRQFDVASLLAPDTDDQTKIEQLYPSVKRFHLAASPIAATASEQDEDIDVVADDDCNEDRRLSSDSQPNYLQPPAHHHYHRSWSNLCLPTFDPRLIGRCYGQYIQQHLPSAVNKRLFNNCENPAELTTIGKESSAVAETTLLDISRKDGDI